MPTIAPAVTRMRCVPSAAAGSRKLPTRDVRSRGPPSFRLQKSSRQFPTRSRNPQLTVERGRSMNHAMRADAAHPRRAPFRSRRSSPPPLKPRRGPTTPRAAKETRSTTIRPTAKTSSCPRASRSSASASRTELPRTGIGVPRQQERLQGARAGVGTWPAQPLATIARTRPMAGDSPPTNPFTPDILVLDRTATRSPGRRQATGPGNGLQADGPAIDIGFENRAQGAALFRDRTPTRASARP